LTGPEELYGHGWQLDGHPLLPTASAPVIGAHTYEVLREYTGMDEAEIERLEATGVLT
jgi:crotonobetainyl-CoA:carnitine CoA-transferase CaiB-like acyl-CoA transferase